MKYLMSLVLVTSITSWAGPTKDFLNLKIQAVNSDQRTVELTLGNLEKYYKGNSAKIKWELLKKDKWILRVNAKDKVSGTVMKLTWQFSKTGPTTANYDRLVVGNLIDRRTGRKTQMEANTANKLQALVDAASKYGEYTAEQKEQIAQEKATQAREQEAMKKGLEKQKEQLIQLAKGRFINSKDSVAIDFDGDKNPKVTLSIGSCSLSDAKWSLKVGQYSNQYYISGMKGKCEFQLYNFRKKFMSTSYKDESACWDVCPDFSKTFMRAAR